MGLLEDIEHEINLSGGIELTLRAIEQDPFTPSYSCSQGRCYYCEYVRQQGLRKSPVSLVLPSKMNVEPTKTQIHKERVYSDKWSIKKQVTHIKD